jgi:hypothetical protein
MYVRTMYMPAGPFVIRVGGCDETKLHHPLWACSYCHKVADQKSHHCKRKPS